MERNSSNALSWVSAPSGGPWKYHFILNEIKTVFLIEVKFTHILHSANAMADTLAKQGEDRISPFVVLFCNFCCFEEGIALVYCSDLPGFLTSDLCISSSNECI